MRFRRKILRNTAKAVLKEHGFARPNKLAYHKEHGVEVEAIAAERLLLDYQFSGNHKKLKKTKRALKSKRRRKV